MTTTTLMGEILAGTVAGFVSGVLGAIAFDFYRSYRNRTRLALSARVIVWNTDFTGGRLVQPPSGDETFVIRAMNPTDRWVIVTAAGWTFVNRPRARFKIGPVAWLWPWRKRWKDRMIFDLSMAHEPVRVQPQNPTSIPQTISRLRERCQEVGRRMAQIEEIWVETIDGRRIEAGVGDAHWTLESLDSFGT
ncbi:MAG: hypothetical protein HY678_00745 [Chloroflexi bacterium]|nr:hypothetical protein [Chloroflexota bacterium]